MDAPIQSCRGPTPAELVPLRALFTRLHWHQRWEVFSGEFTPGRNPVADIAELIGLPRDLRGRRVLDIGPWNGCFSYECERRGASEVVALGPEPPELTGIVELGEIVGSRAVRPVQGSCYTLDPETLGQFDLVLFLGVLYHLRYPLLAFDQIRRVVAPGGTVLVESHVLDEVCRTGDPERPWQRLADVAPSLETVPIWQFYAGHELAGDSSNWFSPNCAGVVAALESAGFEASVTMRGHERAAFTATPRTIDARDCYEDQFPAVLRGLSR